MSKTTEQDKATARPWTTDDPIGSDENELAIKGADGTWLASVWDDRTESSCDEADANAALIVRAVNEHDALVAVAEAAETCALQEEPRRDRLTDVAYILASERWMNNRKHLRDALATLAAIRGQV